MLVLFDWCVCVVLVWDVGERITCAGGLFQWLFQFVVRRMGWFLVGLIDVAFRVCLLCRVVVLYL